MKNAAVAMSGGIDSFATAMYLIKEGYNVFGVTMLIDSLNSSEVDKAKDLCKKIGIRHFIVDASSYFESLKEYVLDSYSNNITPNPCMWCNKNIKYGFLMDEAMKLGADYYATGHYVRVDNKNKEYPRVFKSIDERKDQSYFLYFLKEQRLSRLITPMGTLECKSKIVNSFGGAYFNFGKESTGLCFLRGEKLTSFLERNLGDKRGKFLLEDGTYLYNHNGTFNYTIGQRRRLGPLSYQQNRFVIEIDQQNDIIIGGENGLIKTKIYLEDFNFLNDHFNQLSELDGKFSQWGEIKKCSLDIFGDKAVVNVPSGVRAPARGQHATFYNGDELVGGGIIIGCEGNGVNE